MNARLPTGIVRVLCIGASLSFAGCWQETPINDRDRGAPPSADPQPTPTAPSVNPNTPGAPTANAAPLPTTPEGAFSRGYLPPMSAPIYPPAASALPPPP